MKKFKLPYVFVVGNEKGGAGKTTCSMHLIAGLLHSGLKVSSIDADCRQASLSRYLENRAKYNEQNPDNQVLYPTHYLLKESSSRNIDDKNKEEAEQFIEILNHAASESDVIVIDTPGTHSNFSTIVHSYADAVVTPINDSFIDMDVMARVEGDDMSIIKPSIYSQMVWEQKLSRAQRDQGSIDWVVMRNRLSNIDAQNKRNVAKVLDELQKRLRFRQAPGFGERVIFRELFLKGLTLLDLKKANYDKAFSMSHVAARQELREFLKALNIDHIIELKKAIDPSSELKIFEMEN